MKTLTSVILLAMSLPSSAGSPDDDFSVAFDRHKGRVNSLYLRALKDDPRLAGKIVYDIDIAMSGQVTGCRVRSSAMRAPQLEAKICEVILQMKIPAQSGNVTITKPLEFHPLS